MLKTKPNKKPATPSKKPQTQISVFLLVVKKRLLNALAKRGPFLKHLYAFSGHLFSYWGNVRITILGVAILVIFYQGISFLRINVESALFSCIYCTSFWIMDNAPVLRIYLICLFSLFFFLLLFGYWKENIKIVKRIYRNSEGFVIPLLGGAATLLTFQAVSLFRSASTTEGKTNIIDAWFIFIIIEIIVGIIFYSIKKANLRDDTEKSLEEMLKKHYAPYIYAKEEGKVENKSFYSWTYLNASRVSDSLRKYVTHKNLIFFFNNNEIEIMKKRTIKNLGVFIESNMKKMPPEVNAKFKKNSAIGISEMIDNNLSQNYNFLMILKEGGRNNPKNLNHFKVDIKETKPSFVVFEDLKSRKDKTRFLDINIRQIACVDYEGDMVKLTIIQPNASPRTIFISLSEWLVNRNDLC